MKLDSKLIWTEHIKNIKSKIAKSLYIINSVKRILPKQAKLTLYYSLIYSYMQYGIILWTATNNGNLKNIFKMQKKAIRSITLSKYNAHTRPLFKQLSILELNDIITLENAKFMYKCVNNDLPEKILNLFTKNEAIHNYNTRHAPDLHFNRRKTNVSSKSYIHKGPVIWSNIESKMKQLKTIHSFNINLKKRTP